MTSISSTATSQLHAIQRPPPPPSEKNRLAPAIGSEVSTGAVSSTDAATPTSALDAIDASPTSKTRLTPADIQGRIDGLIADQVGSGRLTSDQATTLKSLLAKNGDGNGRVGGAEGGHGGPPPGPPPGAATDATSSTASATGSTASSDDLLASFIHQLKSSETRATGYASSGSSGTTGNASALLFDFRS